MNDFARLDGRLIGKTDSYKLTHWPQYPLGTEKVCSYLESRGGMFPETVFFGLQYYLKKYLEGVVVTRADINLMEEFTNQHIGPKVFNRLGWEIIVNVHGGKLPVEIKAVPEGTRVNTSNVLMTIENTDPDVPWLTNYLESLLLKVWYPTTVATLSYNIKKLIKNYLEETGDLAGLDFKLHDFGYRGVSSDESGALGAAAHLLNFKGSDTITGVYLLAKYYYLTSMPAFSIPGAEHSTITSWGADHEADAYENMLTKYPTGLVAVVSDSYDIFRACSDIWGDFLREKVLARDGKLIIRPDSGEPAPTVLNVVRILGEKFGYEFNGKGFKVLNPKVGVIQGDGVNIHSIVEILRTLKADGWSTDNIAFGMGGALLQQLNRDTQKFAFKASNINIFGEDRDVYKKPATDSTKNSKAGRLALLYRNNNRFTTVRNGNTNGSRYFGDRLVPVFRNGEILTNYSFDYIRAQVERSDYGETVPTTAREIETLTD